MRAETDTSIGGGVSGESLGARSPARIAVLLEPGARGCAAVAQAAALAALPGSELTLVAIAPQATGPRCCGPAPDAYNCAVRDDVARELREASALLGSVAQSTIVKLLVEGRDPPLEKWVAEGEFDLVLLPARRRVRRSPGHPAQRQLRRVTKAEVRVVGALRVRGRVRPDHVGPPATAR